MSSRRWTWKSVLGEPNEWPAGIGLDLHSGLKLVSATRVDVVGDDYDRPRCAWRIGSRTACHSAIYGEQARIATDFVADADRFVSFIVAAGNCGEQRRGVIVRRLLEIETYRCFVLLGLPVARQVGGRVQELREGPCDCDGVEIGEGSSPRHIGRRWTPCTSCRSKLAGPWSRRPSVFGDAGLRADPRRTTGASGRNGHRRINDDPALSRQPCPTGAGHLSRNGKEAHRPRH